MTSAGSDRATHHDIEPQRLSDDRWPDRFAGTTYLAAIFVAVVAVVPAWRHYFSRPDDVVSLLTIPIVPSLVYAALLSVIAVALRRRLKAAWWILLAWWLVLPQVARVVAMVEGDNVVLNATGFALMAAVLAIAIRTRTQFVAQRVPGSVRGALAVFVLGGAAVLVGGAWLVSAFGTSPGFSESAVYVFDTMLTDLGRIGASSDVHAPLWVRSIYGLAGVVVVLTAAQIMFRSGYETRTLDVPDEAKVRALLRDFGEHDSLGYFATRRDKSIVWDTQDPTSARAGVSYRVIGSVSLASGNPVGDPERWPHAIEAWREHARSNGWSLAVMGSGSEGAQAFAAAGLTAYEIGDEAVVDMAAFSLSGPGLKEVRQSVTRLQRRGYVVRVVRHASLTASDFAALDQAAQQWRGDGGDERGFSMALGRLGDPLDAQCVLVQAHDADGRLRGFLSFVPWGRTGLSLDLMRRDPTADNGLVELMIASLAEQGRSFGVGSGLAQLRHVPGGLRARRRARCRTDGQAVAPGAAAGQPHLAAGVPLPVERQVPPFLATSLHLFRVRLRPASSRGGGRQRRRLPDQAVDLEVAPQGRTRQCARHRRHGARRSGSRSGPAAP